MECRHPSDLVCLICSSHVERPLYLYSVFLPCKHVFHPYCIREWWRRIKLKTCPYCRVGPDKNWETLRFQADAMLVQFGMKHCEDGFKMGNLEIVYQWLISEKQLDGNYYYIRALVNAEAFEVLYDLLSESISSLVKRGYFTLENDVFKYVD